MVVIGIWIIAVILLVLYANAEDNEFDMAKPCLEPIGKAFCESMGGEYEGTYGGFDYPNLHFRCLTEWRKEERVFFTADERKQCGTQK